MMMKVFALLDTKVSAFGTPFFMTHVGHAVRAVVELAQDQSTTVARYPNDFHLYELGAFDDQTGAFELMNPQSLGPVAAFLPNPPKPRLADLIQADASAARAMEPPARVGPMPDAAAANANGRA